ncbi:hypothetical protein O181_103268 [Austropuccinia psidii MF-1]|uniref:Uncharacterized protein n=1 Tax=Austropuccinia psidii MF-1 TaxID=1389203 RepID=A0A9Q3PIW7_9BASI|nr:hypothetical protein [Austropuccinia psidii MF-1]
MLEGLCRVRAQRSKLFRSLQEAVRQRSYHCRQEMSNESLSVLEKHDGITEAYRIFRRHLEVLTGFETDENNLELVYTSRSTSIFRRETVVVLEMAV